MSKYQVFILKIKIVLVITYHYYHLLFGPKVITYF